MDNLGSVEGVFVAELRDLVYRLAVNVVHNS